MASLVGGSGGGRFSWLTPTWFSTDCRCTCDTSHDRSGAPDAPDALHDHLATTVIHDETLGCLQSWAPPSHKPCASQEHPTEGWLCGEPETTSGLGAGDMIDRPMTDLGGGATYIGQWKGAHFHGMGTLKRPDGCYSGSFRDGWAHGYGRFLSSNQSSFEGQWHRGKAHGTGKIVHGDGTSYEGEWCFDEKSGHGIESFPDGTRYVGQFQSNLKHGKGTYVAKNESIQFEGDMVSDKMHGEGTYWFRDGRIYEGQWRDDHIHGSGVMLWRDGSKYVGEMHRNLRHGEGTFFWMNGNVYRGQWRKGAPHGEGTMVDHTGKVTSTIWSAGAPDDAQTDACDVACDREESGVVPSPREVAARARSRKRVVRLGEEDCEETTRETLTDEPPQDSGAGVVETPLIDVGASRDDVNASVAPNGAQNLEAPPEHCGPPNDAPVSSREGAKSVEAPPEHCGPPNDAPVSSREGAREPASEPDNDGSPVEAFIWSSEGDKEAASATGNDSNSVGDLVCSSEGAIDSVPVPDSHPSSHGVPISSSEGTSKAPANGSHVALLVRPRPSIRSGATRSGFLIERDPLRAPSPCGGNLAPRHPAWSATTRGFLIERDPLSSTWRCDEDFVARHPEWSHDPPPRRPDLL